MGAIGLNPIRLDRIGLDPIRINAIKLGVPGAASGTDRPYIDPEVLASLKAVCICYGKSNDDPDRAIVKNLVDPDNPFVISNAAFKLNSGFGKYEVDFTVYNNQNVLVSPNKIVSIAGREFISLLPYTELSKTISSYKIKVTGLIGEFSYWYRNQDGSESRIIITKDGIYQLSTCYNVENGQGSSVGFNGYSESSCTIEQIPSFEGAFVTDGIDDTIISTKTLAEMGITDEVTVVSMIHQIGFISSRNYARNNYFIQGNDFLTNTISAIGKIGIYGYKGNLSNIAIVNDILGDKKDYSVDKANPANIDSVFSVNGTHSSAQLSQIAWYWTIIANKVLTTDQINQVIAYFNLDRTLKPDILCNTIKQGITNENHAEFGDKLIDFSGNGRDIQLNNIAWDGDSGIGKYNYPNWKVTATIANTYSTIVNYPTVNGTYSINVNGVSELMQSIGLHLEIKYTTSTGIIYNDIKQDGVYSYIFPDGATDLTLRFGGIPGIVNEPCNITITQIPSHADALCLDGVNDFGQFVGDLGLKDYTFIADRAYDRIVLEQAPFIASKSTKGQAPFLMEYLNSDNYVYPHSFGATTKTTNLNIQRQISYQSTYVYNGNSISKGTSVDTGDGLTIGNSGSTGEQYSPLCLWSLMLFPYSMSEFLIERQLKKHKLGTLYPNMVEFRPVIKANANYKITYYQIDSTNTWKSIKVGDYIVIGAKLAFQITFDNDASELKEVVSPQLSGIIVEKRPSNPGYNIYSYITSKSPQKINITIDEYIRFEDIVQPYPYVVKLQSLDGHIYTYGDKLRIGDKIKRGEAINLLPGLYEGRGLTLNGVQITSNEAIITISKSMVFTANKIWLLDTTEPHAIYSPQKLNIPNSSLKILGYVPDLTGKGNHGKLNNFAYTEDSGVTADGSVKFDGTDDHITIPTLAHGGKCVMMKVNWNKNNSMLYDQRVSYSTKFAVLINAGTIAYNQTNPLGVTYIDGIENTNILCDELKGITHNIVSANANPDNSKSPNIGVNLEGNGGFSDMSLYEFMLFPEIPSEDEIKKLNNVMGIEGGYVESPNYYWDSFGKSNNQADDIDKGIRNINDSRIYLFDKSVEGLSTIEQINISGQIRPLLNRALQLKNVGYNSESGYNGYIELLFNKWSVFINENRAEIDRTGTTLNITKVYIQNKAILYCGIGHYLADIPSKYKITGVDDTHPIKFGNDGFPNELILTVTKDGEYEVDWYNYGKNPCIMAGFIGDCNITIEQVAQYPNGLLLDGVEDHAVNTVIPAVTDFTVIAKRSTLDTNINSAFVTKGTSNTYNKAAFMLEFKSSASIQIGSFGILNNGQNIPDLITYMTPTDYNKAGISKGTAIDENGLIMGKYSNTHYWNGVFYKLMFYTKTIDQLSINMLKNLFERDELIDVTNPIFKKQ